MSKLLKEIVVITGSYNNSNGEKKNRYTKIGSIIETAKGPMIKMDTIPLKEGGWDGWAYLNDPKPRDDGGVPNPQMGRTPNRVNSMDNYDDNIPF
jgi:hypothetical protein